MTGVNKLLFVVVYTAVFLIIFLIALLSEASLPASLTRALTASTLFTVLVWVILKIINVFILSGIRAADETAAAAENPGTTLNITVTDDLSDEELLMGNHQDTSPNAAVPGVTVPNATVSNQAAVPESSRDGGVTPEGFTPLTTRQIDPQIENIINSDPKRLAEIVKKMGFDD